MPRYVIMPHRYYDVSCQYSKCSVLADMELRHKRSTSPRRQYQCWILPANGLLWQQRFFVFSYIRMYILPAGLWFELKKEIRSDRCCLLHSHHRINKQKFLKFLRKSRNINLRCFFLTFLGLFVRARKYFNAYSSVENFPKINYYQFDPSLGRLWKNPDMYKINFVGYICRLGSDFYVF